MKDGFAIFDAHAHIGAALHSGRSQSAGDLLRRMDACGVDRALAIPFPVVEDYRAAHDEIGRAVREHPDRFTGAASMNPYLAGFRDEIRRCAELYGFRALKLQPQYHGLDPLSRRSRFFFETALENRLAVVCHTGSGAPYALPSLLMAPAREYSDLPIVVAHAGGGIYVGEAIVAALFCPNIFIEVSSLAPHQVRQVLERVPSARLMVGSDLPENLETEMGKILGLEIPAEDRANILSGTAERLFL